MSLRCPNGDFSTLKISGERSGLCPHCGDTVRAVPQGGQCPHCKEFFASRDISWSLGAGGPCLHCHETITTYDRAARCTHCRAWFRLADVIVGICPNCRIELVKGRP